MHLLCTSVGSIRIHIKGGGLTGPHSQFLAQILVMSLTLSTGFLWMEQWFSFFFRAIFLSRRFDDLCKFLINTVTEDPFTENTVTEDPFTETIACVDGSFATDEEDDTFVSLYDLGKQRSEQFFLRMIRKFLINSATEDPFTQALACVDGSFTKTRRMTPLMICIII